MIVVAIDTSAAASVALVDGERLIADRTEFAARRHVEFVGPALAEVLAEGRAEGLVPDAVVVGIGPGPFTGLRAGIAAGIGAALGIGVPVHGVVSHDALALRALANTPAGRPVCRRRGQVSDAAPMRRARRGGLRDDVQRPRRRRPARARVSRTGRTVPPADLAECRRQGTACGARLRPVP